MKPIFFPFTYLRQQDKKILLSCFKTFSFFSTSAKNELEPHKPDKVNNLCVDPGVDLVPMEDDELQPVLETLNEYKKWALLNDGNLDSLKTLFRTTPYFTSDTGVAAIRSEIGKRSTMESPSHGNPVDGAEQIFLKSLLFLRLAHDSDAANEAIESELQSVVTGETDLFLKIRGEMEKTVPDRSTVAPKYDPGRLMTEKRLNAWAHVLNRKSLHYDPKKPLILVTTSPGIADYFESVMSDTGRSADNNVLVDIKKFDIQDKNSDFNSRRQETLKTQFQDAMAGRKITEKFTDKADEGCPCVDIKLYKFSFADMNRFFCSPKLKNSPESLEVTNKLVKKFYKNTFVCFINIKKWTS